MELRVGISTSATPTTTTICKTTCEGVKIPERILKIFPAGSASYHACQVRDSSPSDDQLQFTATLRLRLSDQDEFEKWRRDFQESSHATWRVRRSVSANGLKILFKKSYRCQHNTRPVNTTTDSKRRTKHTNCQASMTVTIKKSTFQGHTQSRSKDVHLPHLPTEVILDYSHNHAMLSADALRFRDVSEETRAKLTSLFKRSYGPTQALQTLKQELEMKHGESFPDMLTDRAICPDKNYVHRLYAKVIPEKSSKKLKHNMLASLQEHIDSYNADKDSPCIAMDVMKNKKPVIAVCTPLMKRVHEAMDQSGEIVFIDASSNVDRRGCYVYLLQTHSCVGGLPLGVLITTSESEAALQAALQLYSCILPQRCFGGRGLQGPAVFMVDDYSALRSAVQTVFPKPTCLLCVYHALQATWRWLWDARNQVARGQIQYHLHQLFRLFYTNSPDELDMLYQQTLQDSMITEKFKKYLNTCMLKREAWALCSQQTPSTTYCEAAMGVLNDKILERTQNFNIAQVLDFTATLFEDHYRQRLVDCASGRLENSAGSKLTKLESSITREDIQEGLPSQFTVSGQDTVHYVNTLIGHCSCQGGRTGQPCIHQAAVAKHFNLSPACTEPVTDSKTRLLLCQIATDDDLTRQLDEMCKGLLTRFAQNPDVFRPALKAMVAHYHELTTDAQLAAAMQTFGKAAIRKSKRKERAEERKHPAKKKRKYVSATSAHHAEHTSTAMNDEWVSI